MSRKLEIDLTLQIWKEGDMYVSYTPELDVSSCGKTVDESRKNIHEAIGLFLEEAENMGTLEEILGESGFIQEKGVWRKPHMVMTVEKILPCLRNFRCLKSSPFPIKSLLGFLSLKDSDFLVKKATM